MKRRIMLLLYFMFALHLSSADTERCIAGNCDNGKGSSLNNDWSVYQGEWRNRLRNGGGRIFFLNGSELRGGFLDGEPHGIAYMFLSDGRVKKIRFNKGRAVSAQFVSDYGYDGRKYGSYTYRGKYSGWYTGDSVEGYKPDGRGIMKWDDGSEYSGEWAAGRISGRGVMKWNNKSNYIGEWISGRRSGYGVFTDFDGSVQSGRWRDNVLIEVIEYIPLKRPIEKTQPE